ncbi:hypothetical protein [Halobacillus mangrovi]|nr:hypothetical protein [Halobacillus mangrovi]
MSNQSNKKMWYLWEERWSGKKRLYQLRYGISNGMNYLFPVFLGAETFWIMTIVFLVIAIVTGYRNGGKEWEAKEHYLEQFHNIDANHSLPMPSSS